MKGEIILSRIKRRNLHIALLLLLVFFFTAIGFIGCGGSKGNNDTEISPTPTPTATSTTGLRYNTTYNWQVVAKSSSYLTTEGPVWAFTTESGTGTVIEGPVTPDIAGNIAGIHIEREQARHEVMERYGRELGNLSAKSVGEAKELKGDNGKVLAYVFELDPKGYIVVPSNSAFPPVIAYSYTSNFSWKDVPQNTLLHLLKKDLTLRFEALEKGLIPSNVRAEDTRLWSDYLGKKMPKDAGKTIWGPLFTFSTWSQDSPYNDDCPMDPQTSQRTVVGCGATSTAQIWNYWETPTSLTLTSSDSYTTTTRNISIDAPTASFSGINYNNHNPSNAAKADLSFAAGILMEMDYTSDVSYCYLTKLTGALKDSRVGYTNSTVEYYNQSGFSDTNVISNIKSSYPLIMLIESPAGNHFLNCDGYDDSNDTFHMNFGWGGSSDGWYSLPNGLPGGYTGVYCSVLNIYPQGQPTPTPTPTVSPTATPTVSPTPSPTGPGPQTPDNPRPPDKSSDVSVNTVMHWNFCVGAGYYDLYLWPSNQNKPSTPTASDLTEPEYTP